MLQIVSGFIISLIVEGAKRVQAVPLTATQTTRIRSVAGILSVAMTIGSTLLVAWADGGLNTLVQGQDFQQHLATGIGFVANIVVTWFWSVISYHGFLKKSTPVQPTITA